MNSIKRKIGHLGLAALVASGVFALSGCTTTGKIGQMSKFDIILASPDDIAEALKNDGRVAISGNLLFETDSAQISPNAADVVNRISYMMKSNPDIKIAVVGHTDSTGEYKYNLQLSERRARAMVEALAKEGISTNRLAAVGVGQLMPVASNDTVEGRAQNRRVELVLVQ